MIINTLIRTIVDLWLRGTGENQLLQWIPNKWYNN